MESDHETGNSTRSVASATRMPSDATDDDEVREREFLQRFAFTVDSPTLYDSRLTRAGQVRTCRRRG